MLMIEKCTNNMEIGKILEYLAQTAKKKEDIMKYTNTTPEELETIKKMKI